jgi:hypothetical protein
MLFYGYGYICGEGYIFGRGIFMVFVEASVAAAELFSEVEAVGF